MGRRRSPRLHPQIHASEQGAGMARRRSPRLHPQIHASEDGVRMTRRIRRRRGKSPAEPASLPDDDDILREILVRLPPLPSSLPRASAVCKRWRGLVTDPRFLRQLYAHHRKPPLLGVFSRRKHLGNEFQFNPILDPPDRIPPRRFNLGRCSSHNGYNFLDSRHGLVLVEIRFLKGVVVWDPISSEQRRLAIPPEFETRSFNGAVICAAGEQGHVHGGCHSNPFKVVLMSAYKLFSQSLVCVYSSETGIWGNLILTEASCKIRRQRPVLVGNSLYWVCSRESIFEFDLGEHGLTVIAGPPVADDIIFQNHQVIQDQHGALGYAILSYPHFELWQRKANGHGGATWVLETHTILELPQAEGVMVLLLAYDCDSDVILLSVSGNTYMVQLKSMQSRKLYETIDITGHLPFKSFYTPGTAIAGGLNGAEMLQT
ncbi:uncharacterized protein LOC124697255 [Lolium rigidum]|uniref:uncharacterized protein LOC124697255 n=1 Tax=Lolium rigidum TaxID=89674 RepID=UPI001F5DFAB2|nr:uncharacterized protein LOC124697255 [Lolium rigidum]